MIVDVPLPFGPSNPKIDPLGTVKLTLLTAVSERLKAWKRTAEQLPLVTVWQRVCEFIVTHVTGFNWLARQRLPQLMHCT